MESSAAKQESGAPDISGDMVVPEILRPDESFG